MDTLFFIAIVGVTFSGILISKDVLQLFGITLNPGQGWKMIHSLTADLSVITLGIHIALHWKWITTNLSRYIVNPIRSLGTSNTGSTQGQHAPRTLAIQPVRINDQK